MFEKNRMVAWKRYLAVAMTGGLFVLSTSAAFAAPVELTLDDAVALALKNNLNITIAGVTRESTAWKINQAQTGKKWSVDYTLSGSRTKSTGANGAVDAFGHKISATLPLYTGGTVEAGIKQAEINLKVADWDVEKNKQQVKLDATTGYFDILQARNVLKVDQESVDQLAAHLKNVEAQYNVGTVAKSDVLQSEVKLANAKQLLIAQQNTYDIAISSLNNVLCLPLDTELEIKEELSYTKYDDISLEDCIKRGLANRPEVMEADLNVEYYKQGVISVKGNKKPKVSLNGTVNLADDKLPGTDNNGWSVGVTAQWSVFDSGRIDSQVKQSDADFGKAQYTAKQTRDSVALAVRQAYLNMKAAEKQIDTTKVAVEQAEEDFKIAKVRYSSGVGTNLDVMDAELSLTQAKTNYIQALYNYNTSKAKLDKAMGAAVK
ncbi:MAG: TolC family protein [Pelosinus sp.]|nr:TolC family protein [Pelosinus sp.]